MINSLFFFFFIGSQVAILLIGLAAYASCLPKNSRDACDSNSDCVASKECCFKQITIFPEYSVAEFGKCTTYLSEGADCSGLWMFAGCGCEPGLICISDMYYYAGLMTLNPAPTGKGMVFDQKCRKPL